MGVAGALVSRGNNPHPRNDFCISFFSYRPRTAAYCYSNSAVVIAVCHKHISLHLRFIVPRIQWSEATYFEHFFSPGTLSQHFPMFLWYSVSPSRLNWPKMITCDLKGSGTTSSLCRCPVFVVVLNTPHWFHSFLSPLCSLSLLQFHQFNPNWPPSNTTLHTQGK